MKDKDETGNKNLYDSSGLSSIYQFYNDTSDNEKVRSDDSTLVEKEYY